MQSRQEDYDYGARAEIQVARLLSTNNHIGDRWSTPAAYQISVLNFEFDKDDKSPLSWYTMRKENGTRLSDKLNVIFFDLIKIHKLLGKPVGSLSKLEKWGMFLSYADDERQEDYINEIIKSEGGLMSAKSSLLTVSQDEINWARQNSIFIAHEDRAASLYNAEKRGLERGIQQGQKQGERNAKLETAKLLISDGRYSISEVATLLNISKEEITEAVNSN